MAATPDVIESGARSAARHADDAFQAAAGRVEQIASAGAGAASDAAEAAGRAGPRKWSLVAIVVVAVVAVLVWRSRRHDDEIVVAPYDGSVRPAAA